MAYARESKSGLYLTPLHVAVLNNRRHIARYLGGRFPETFKMADKKGRTPLHYAGMHPHGGYIYKLLLILGADKTSEDDVSASITEKNSLNKYCLVICNN